MSMARKRIGWLAPLVLSVLLLLLLLEGRVEAASSPFSRSCTTLASPSILLGNNRNYPSSSLLSRNAALLQQVKKQRWQRTRKWSLFHNDWDRNLLASARRSDGFTSNTAAALNYNSQEQQESLSLLQHQQQWRWKQLSLPSKLAVGTIDVVLTMGQQWLGGFISGYILGSLTGVIGLVRGIPATATATAAATNRWARWHGKSFRWGKTWASFGAIYAGSERAANVFIQNYRPPDGWTTIYANIGLGLWFGYQEHVTKAATAAAAVGGGSRTLAMAMAKNALMYGGFGYLLMIMTTPKTTSTLSSPPSQRQRQPMPVRTTRTRTNDINANSETTI